jgi:NAD+ kinase
MHIAVFGRVTKTTNFEVLRDFFLHLQQEGITYSILGEYAVQLSQHKVLEPPAQPARLFDTVQQVQGADFLYCIGGDGTILDAVHFLGRTPIPILGVNAGRLGFLASVSQYELKLATADLKRNAWKTDPRTLLTLESRPAKIFETERFGLNEITIHKSNSNEMIVIHTFINGEFLNSYWTDGLIVSTPTGSTAYSMACGGPIISPRSSVLVITPIAPHSLTVRPMIIPDNSVISFEIESRSGQALVAVDNGTTLVPENIELAVKKADFVLNLVKLPSRSYFNTLRNRLNWGLDNRN